MPFLLIFGLLAGRILGAPTDDNVFRHRGRNKYQGNPENMRNGRRSGKVKRQEIMGDGLLRVKTFDDAPEYSCRLRKGNGRGRRDVKNGRTSFCEYGSVTILAVEEDDDDNVSNNRRGERRNRRMSTIITDSDTGMIYEVKLDGTVTERHVSDFPDEDELPNKVGVRDDGDNDIDSGAAVEQDYQDFEQQPGRLLLRGSFRGGNSTTSSMTPRRDLQDTTIVYVDILVIWTQAMEDSAGSSAQALADAQQGVNSFNVAAENSDVYTRLNLVHAEKDQSGYVETSVSGALYAAQDANDYTMDYVHALRDQKGADIVAVITAATCGVAYTNFANPAYMFSVTGRGCIGQHTFAHEVGHNMGCFHDKGTESVCGTAAYNYGYRDPGASFRSVLAYNCVAGQCDNIAGNGCSRVLQFSNPSVTYNGKVTGSASGTALGETNNAKTLNENRITMAGHRAEVADEPTCTSDQDCSDPHGCTSDSCVDGKCVHTANDASCDDNNFCTGQEYCNTHIGCDIFGKPPDCDDGVACTVDSCNSFSSSTGECIYTPDDSLCNPCPGLPADQCCFNYECNLSSGCVVTPKTDCCGNGMCDAGEDETSCPGDCGVQSMRTTLEANSYANGNIFKIKSPVYDIVVYGFDLHLYRTSSENVQVWTKPGDYVETNPSTSGWNQIYDEDVTGQWIGNPSPLQPFYTPVQISAGTVQTFHVATRNILYTAGVSVGNLHSSSTAILEFYEGRGCDAAWSCPFEPRVWNGDIYYEVVVPSSSPSITPSANPVPEASEAPSSVPSATPTPLPSDVPSSRPSTDPVVPEASDAPSSVPSTNPVPEASGAPSSVPTANPVPDASDAPSLLPTTNPVPEASDAPSLLPSANPTPQASDAPSSLPTTNPVPEASDAPSLLPSANPTPHASDAPSSVPSVNPTPRGSGTPSSLPSANPTPQASDVPSSLPSANPSPQASGAPSSVPTANPVPEASDAPSSLPSANPVAEASDAPSSVPTSNPTPQASDVPSSLPSANPTPQASGAPSSIPSANPTPQSSDVPSSLPSANPVPQASGAPSSVPSANPVPEPSDVPSTSPSASPVTIQSDDLHWVACGRVGRCSESKDLAESDDVHEIRCCADEVPNPVPSGWIFVNRGGGCPFSESPVECPVGTYTEAKDICEAAGARLCTVTELESNCARGTGCSFDNDLIWSSTVGVPPPPSPAPTIDDSWTQIFFNDFDDDTNNGGWDDFNDGGGDVIRNTNTANTYNGSRASIRLVDNSGDQSSTWADLSAVPGITNYDLLRVKFWFYVYSFEGSEDFFVEVSYDNANWQEPFGPGSGNYVLNQDFGNGFRGFSSVDLPVPSSGEFYLRFRCDASGNGDYLFIDNVEIQAKNDTST